MARKTKHHKGSVPRQLSAEREVRIRKDLDKLFNGKRCEVSLTFNPGTKEEVTMTSEEWQKKRGLLKKR